MKIRRNITIDDAVNALLEKRAEERKMSSSAYIEYLVEKTTSLDEMMTVFVHDKGKGAATFNFDNMELILRTFREFKDAQHFFNKMVFNWASKAMNASMVEKGVIMDNGAVDKGKMNDAMRAFLQKQNNPAQASIEVDADGNPIYESV